MANNIITSTLVKDLAFGFSKENIFTKLANSDYIDNFGENAGGFISGQTINVKQCGSPTVTTGLAVAAQDIVDRVLPVTISDSDIYSVAFEVGSLEEYTDLGGRERFWNDYGQEIVASLGAQVQKAAAQVMQKSAYLTPVDTVAKFNASSFSTIDPVEDVVALADYQRLSYQDRNMVTNSRDASSLRKSLSNSFNDITNSDIQRRARIGNLSGFDFYQTPTIPKHVAGTGAGTAGVTVTALSADGLTLSLAGLAAAATLKAGDRISIPSVKLLNQIAKDESDYGLVVTVSADAVASGAGAIDVVLSAPLLATGPHRNVSALPAAAASVEIYADRRSNFAFTKQGLTMVTLPMAKIAGADSTVVKDKDSGCWMHMTYQGSATSGKNIMRVSLLCAFAVFPEYVIEYPVKS